MSRIFISYRRSDSISEAGRIYDYLHNHFGRASIFKDVDDIDAGDDFRDRVTQAVGQCQILLAVIGKDWLQAKDAAGNRRLDNPADWVRLEIETALNRNIRVIPVLLTGVEMPAVQTLPTALKPLAYRNAARVRHDPDFRRDMERVVGVIERHFEGLAQPSTQAVATPSPIPSEPVVPTPPRKRPPVQSVSKPSRAVSQSPRAVTPHVGPKRGAVGQRRKEKPFARLGNVMGRRRAMQVLGFTGGGLGTLWVGRQLFRPRANRSNVNEANFKIARFKTVTVNDKGETIREDNNQARVFRETIGEVPLDMVWIPGGTFMMGSPESEAKRSDREDPQHEVTLQPFLMGRHEVTQAQWRQVAALDKIDIELEANPARFQDEGDNRPVEQVSWLEAVEFCQRLSDYTGREYRLPSEAEWEYACRARTTTPFHLGETLTAEFANYQATEIYQNGPIGDYRETTTDVGDFSANGFGLYDMHGNVWEWCADHWHDNYDGAPTDGSAWLSDDLDVNHVLRGGSWIDYPRHCRSAFRNYFTPEDRDSSIGFRVSCAAPRTLL